jgi:hypothetical protein
LGCGGGLFRELLSRKTLGFLKIWLQGPRKILVPVKIWGFEPHKVAKLLKLQYNMLAVVFVVHKLSIHTRNMSDQTLPMQPR